MRTTGSAFALEAPEVVLPRSIAPDDEASWTIGFAPTDTGDAEEIFFVDLTVNGEQARYPITLYGDGE
jgi:hypothetical protein